MMPEIRAVIDLQRTLFHTLSQDIVVSQPLGKRLFRVSSKSVNKIVRKNREVKSVHIVVERP